MSIVLFIMFVIYATLMVIASRKRIFEMPTPVDTSDIDIEDMMKDAEVNELRMGRDQFEKFKATLSRNSNEIVALWAGATCVAIFMMIGVWYNLGPVATGIYAVGVFAVFVFYRTVRGKRKKEIFVKGRDLFRMQTGYILDTESKSVDYYYRTASSRYRKGTANFHKVLVGIINKEGKPEAYLVDMDYITFGQVIESELCDVVTYNGNFVAACYLIQKAPKE